MISLRRLRSVTALSDREYRRAFYQAVDVQQGLDPRREFYVPIYSKPGMERFDLVLRDLPQR